MCSESTLELLDSRAISNVMSRKMVDKLHIRMIEVASCVFEKCVGHLRDVPIQTGALVVTL